MKEQENIVCENTFEEDPQTMYLLGFDSERLKPSPQKTYIRRLWLAFESSSKAAPKRFFDPQAERFSKEIKSLASDLANNPLRLAAELQADTEYGIDGRSSSSRFLLDKVHTLLVTRMWGEALWGCKKLSEEEHKQASGFYETGMNAKQPSRNIAAKQQSRKRERGEDRHLELLANSKPEEGDSEPPEWPRDEQK